MTRHIKTSSKLAFALLLLWCAGYGFFCYSILHLKPTRPQETSDAIIVLTGGNHRIATALELFASGRATHLFISGANPQVTTDEIKALWKGPTALPPCCITLGKKSTTTIENAQEVREWMKEKKYSSVRLVTSGYHMPRALLELHHALPDVTILPNPVEQPDYTIEDKKFWVISFSEYNKMIWRAMVLTVMPKQGPVQEAL